MCRAFKKQRKLIVYFILNFINLPKLISFRHLTWQTIHGMQTSLIVYDIAWVERWHGNILREAWTVDTWQRGWNLEVSRNSSDLSRIFCSLFHPCSALTKRNCYFKKLKWRLNVLCSFESNQWCSNVLNCEIKNMDALHSSIKNIAHKKI